MPQEPWPFGLPALSYVLILASAKAEHKPLCVCVGETHLITCRIKEFMNI